MNKLASSRARSIADLADNTILATVDIAAPPERVFRALASREIVNWWGADDLYRTTDWTGDVRVGGRFRSSGVGADGSPFSVAGEYLEIDPPHTLVHTWEPDWDPGSSTRVAYRLQPIDGGTRLTLRHTGFTSAQSCNDHADGWTRVLGWLAAHVAPTPPRTFFFIRLVPPRPSFAMDLSDDERRMMGEHSGYWRQLLADGVAIAFGPVADPNGPWGLGLVEAESAEAVKALEANDPAIRANAGFRYEVLPLLQGVVRPRP